MQTFNLRQYMPVGCLRQLYSSSYRYHSSIVLLLHSFSPFLLTGLTPWPPAVFRFSQACRF